MAFILITTHTSFVYLFPWALVTSSAMCIHKSSIDPVCWFDSEQTALFNFIYLI